MLFFVLILMINNSLVDWYKQSILLAFTFVEDRSQGFSILPVFQSLFPHSISPVSIWVLIPVSTILLQIKNYKNSLLSLTVFVGLASWLQYYPVSGIRHQYWAATPMIPLFCYFVYQLSQQVIVTAYPHKDKLAKYLAIILIILSFLPDISQRLVSGFIKFNTYYEHVDEPSVLKGMKLSAKEQKFFGSIASEITSYLDNNPNSNVVTSGPDALYLTFDPRIRNIHPMYVSWEMVNNSIYPNYNSIFDSYYKNEHPLIILRDNSAPDGYCTLVLEAQYNLMSLAKPCD